MSELTFTDQNFEEEVLKSQEPVLVDFWAPWCGPCKMQGPIIQDLAQSMEGKSAKIGKLNVDENQETTGKLQIVSIPTLLIFKGGQVVEQMVGVQDKNTLAQKLEAHMN